MPRATGGAVPPSATIERLIQSMTAWPGRGDDALAVLNGLFGHAWAEQQSVLAVPMTVRTAMGDELPLERDAMRHMLHDSGPRRCVFVHVLTSTESVWRFSGRSATSCGGLLARDHGVTP